MKNISVIDRLLSSIADTFTPDVAQKITAIRMDKEGEGRMEELSLLNYEGRMYPEQRLELEAIVRVIDFVTILQAKAQQKINEAT